MIALADNLPLVRLPDERAVHFERRWIERAIVSAAEQAGYSRWWLAAHVCESVAIYLQHDFEDPVVGADCLRNLVCSVLQVIGFPEVARHFTLPDPPVRISLESLARASGSGYELVFFHRLDEALHEALATPAAHVELQDLAACVKYLRAAKTWRRDCTQLCDEIVEHVREKASRIARREPLSLELT